MAVSAEVQSSPPPPAPAGGRVARNASVYFVGQLASWFVTFLYLSVIPRLLAERAWGEMTVAMTVVNTIAGIFTCGMESYLVKEIGRLGERSEHLIRATLGLRLAAQIPMVVACLIAFRVMHVGT